MSDLVATFNALRARLATWTTLPLYWPNDDRTPTLNSDTAPNGYVFSEIRITDEAQMSLGSPTFRRDYGELSVYVNVPLGTRTGTAEQYAQELRALFGTLDVAGVVVTRKTMDLGQLVESSDGRLWSVRVGIEWFADRTE